MPLTKVIFGCLKCGAAYIATQHCRSDVGSFDCWDCAEEIFCWSGDYRYGNWKQMRVM
jgi:predicted RNA-binding Zn-ribbon protein involved in translation (DUF1610 family)